MAPATPKQRLVAGLRRRPQAVARVARSTRRMGAPGASQRLEAATDLVWVEPDGATAPFHLHLWDRSDQVARDVADLGWQAFEAPLPAVLVSLVRRFCRHGRFADVGANTGYYALLAAAVDPSVQVDAFEPYPPVLSALRQNVALNHASRVEVHPIALSSDRGRATLFVPVESLGIIETSSSLNPSFSVGGVGATVEVDMRTLDDVYGDTAEPPQVLKIDVESLEPDVVFGGAELIERTKPIIVLELLPHIDPQPLEALRSRFDYVDIRLQPDTAVISGAVVGDPDAWNHLWCPRAAVAEVTELLRGDGLRIA